MSVEAGRAMHEARGSQPAQETEDIQTRVLRARAEVEGDPTLLEFPDLGQGTRGTPAANTGGTTDAGRDMFHDRHGGAA